MHDGIELDDRGLPTAVLVTEPFIPTVKEIAKIRALPDYPFVVLEHPLGSLSDAELRRRARQAAPQIARILCAER